MGVDLYASKSKIVRRLEAPVEWLVRRGISADSLTLAAVPVAMLGGAALLASPAIPALLLGVPILAATRLVLNLLDGAVARRSRQSHPRGELLNEIGDRIADVAFLAPVAVLPGADAVMVLSGVLAAVLASYAGLASRAAGGERIYRGILSKPGRMVLVSATALAALVIGEVAWTAFGPLLLLGASITVAERVLLGLRGLP